MAQARRRPGLSRAARVALALCAASLAVSAAATARRRRVGARIPRSSPRFAASGSPTPIRTCCRYDGRVRFFLVIGRPRRPLAVSLPPDATDDERRALRRGARGWEGRGPRRALRSVDTVSRVIEFGFVCGTVDTARGTGHRQHRRRLSHRTASQQGGADVAGAELVLARIRIARITNQDTQGHQRPLTTAELAGTALHELGHALGFQGHARHGDTVMVRETETHRARRQGRCSPATASATRACARSTRCRAARSSASAPRSTAVARDLVDRMARLAEQNQPRRPLRARRRIGRAASSGATPKGLEYGLVIGATARGAARSGAARGTQREPRAELAGAQPRSPLRRRPLMLTWGRSCHR